MKRCRGAIMKDDGEEYGVQEEHERDVVGPDGALPFRKSHELDGAETTPSQGEVRRKPFYDAACRVAQDGQGAALHRDVAAQQVREWEGDSPLDEVPAEPAMVIEAPEDLDFARQDLDPHRRRLRRFRMRDHRELVASGRTFSILASEHMGQGIHGAPGNEDDGSLAAAAAMQQPGEDATAHGSLADGIPEEA